jgi:hypothetical protein
MNYLGLFDPTRFLAEELENALRAVLQIITFIYRNLVFSSAGREARSARNPTNLSSRGEENHEKYSVEASAAMRYSWKTT